MHIAVINLSGLTFAIILIYIPFHLFEEALGNFPKWMHTHRWIPEQITYGHWMANNIFFYFSLLQIGFVISVLHPGFQFLQVGILVWGAINLLDHLVYTIIDRKKSPGIYTGFLFGIVATTGLVKVYNDGTISPYGLIASLCMGAGYAFLPVLLSMLFHKTFKRIFV